MRQSSRPPPLLPACAFALSLGIVGLPASGFAQSRYRVAQTENFRRDPSATAPILASMSSGVELRGGRTRSGWVEITLEGWIWAESVERSTGEEHDLRVRARNGENLRTSPNRTIIGRVTFGTLLDELDRDDSWIHVQRTGWMWGRSLEGIADAASDPPAPDSAGPNESASLLDQAVLANPAPLLNAPDGDTTATLRVHAPVTVLARSGGLVRVRMEGWVRESDLRSSAPGVRVGVSAAEIRARPSAYEGTLVQWTLHYIAVREADELRGMPLGQPYMQARGPLPEAGFVYVMLSPEQRDEVEQLTRLAEVIIIGRVYKVSRYLGNPILELVALDVRQQ